MLNKFIKFLRCMNPAQYAPCPNCNSYKVKNGVQNTIIGKIFSAVAGLLIIVTIPLLFIFPPALLLSFGLVAILTLPIFFECVWKRTVWLKCKACAYQFTKPLNL